MTITVTHSKVSAIPDGTDTSVVRPSDWNATHTLVGVGTAASLDAGVANGVATLDSGGQVPLSQLPPLGDLNYQGAWNANTNSPTLTSSTGTKGYYYVVSVAGTTNLNGITDWQVGDWAVFNGSVWQKIDNTDAVTSVNGYTGTVVLTAADVSAVPYTGATTAVDLNAKTLTNIAHLGLNSTAVPDILFRAYGDNNSTSRIAIRGYSSNASSSSMRIAKFRGTYAAPQAPLSGDSLGKFELAGYGTTSANGYPQASYEGVATENWGATARGAKALFYVTPNTTITQAVALTINQDSTATFANTVTANGVLLTGNTGTVTSVAATAGTGISVSGSPITTSGTLTITNTAPDQTVAFTNGTGISVTGTYPNFTVTNTAPSSGGTVTSVTGTAPVVSSGGTTPAISMAAANTTTNGYLTSTDWNTFNGKGSGTVTSVAQSFTGGLISVAGSPITSSGTLALTVAGTSGGIPYFSSGTAWASSAALTQYGVVYGGGAGAAPVATAAGTTGQVLTATTSGAPTWANPATSGTVTSVGLSAPAMFTVTGSPVTSSGTLALSYSGTALPLANGGTGATSAPAANASLFGFTTTATSATPLVLTNTSSVYQLFTGSTAQTVTLPVTSTLTAGWTFHIVNNSTQNITVNSSGANLVCTVIPNTTSMVTCILITGTTAASWEFGFTDFGAITGTGSVVMSTSPTLVTPVLGTPASGTVTNLTGTASININGTVGATTASTGAFTTLTASTSLATSNSGTVSLIGTGAIAIGATTATTALTVGQSTVSQTTNIQAGATASASTKAINIGTGGLAGSTTTIIIGSTAGTSTTTVNGTLTAGTGVTGGIAGGTF